ncbi:GNAT family N-acetyltransferase [Nocardiopsis salina]|uniref:GNAT family N-acetyltransferase n=1 Tax=Nocardiopsis salina TaxID=245836 RepID=UPI00034C3A2F|nr:GNAT family N-acetyltransferase [Nocardiopsis salina]
MLPTPAHPADATALTELREACARWQQQRGIDQWSPGELSLATFADQIDRRQWWVLRDGHTVQAAVRLLDEDPHIWPEEPAGGALYVHGLMADRTRAGRGTGGRLLTWAEERARERGLHTVRLDCVAHNHALRSYYEHRGYLRRATHDFGPDSALHPVMRYEKPLDPR